MELIAQDGIESYKTTQMLWVDLDQTVHLISLRDKSVNNCIMLCWTQGTPSGSWHFGTQNHSDRK